MMTSDAKDLLGKTIRGLRDYLLKVLGEAMDSDYQLGIAAIKKTTLSAGPMERRRRLEDLLRTGDTLESVIKQAAYTLLNRLVVLKLLEGMGLRREKLVTGFNDSRAYRDFRQLSPAISNVGDSEGYALLLDLTYRELALELPGLFGSAGPASALALVSVPAYVLREVITRLNDKALDSCWQDDMTLGWVYQYWNDPEREALDAKLNRREKLEPGEIASKTQMFTERYMVDWLLQNSLGPMWLAMCAKHGWVAECAAGGDGGEGGVLSRLEARRVEWRAMRERGPEQGGVALTDLMPVSEDEARWAYYVPQPIPAEAVAQAPESLDALKLLDPAVGSGHFLIVAFDLLFALHKEEDRHRGRTRSEREIAEWILGKNLYGIDLDPRAVQIAAAALWLKAKRAAGDCQPETMNLVAANLRLSELAKDDPALVELRAAVQEETGIPGELTDKIIAALKGADWIGSLLKVEDAVGQAISEFENRGLFSAWSSTAWSSLGNRENIYGLLERFLEQKTNSGDLGLRVRGEQLASGVRLVRMLREGQYDLVVGNPPYQGTAKMRETTYLTRHYPRGKADLYAMFLERGLQLVREGGVSALLTMRNWMFIKQYSELRQWLLQSFDIRSIGDFAVGAFDEVPNDILSVSVVVFHAYPPVNELSIGQQPSPPDDRSYDRQRTSRKRAATLAQVGRHEFRATDLRVVPEWPVLYWWSADVISRFGSRLVGESSPARFGLTTGGNERFCRDPWEVRHDLSLGRWGSWAPFVLGAKGAAWIEGLWSMIRWRNDGLEVKIKSESQYGSVSKQIRNEDLYFRRGVAFSAIGALFQARVHRFPSVFSNAGLSLYPDDLSAACAFLNTTVSRRIVQDLAPGLRFDVGDVNRIPWFDVDASDAILARLDGAFTTHESHREPSVEFRSPGPSPWRHAQEWAQLAVDRPENTPLPPYVEQLDAEPATDHVSYALGIALGRFDLNGQGILDPTTADLSHALPYGILFLDGSLADNEHSDSLGDSASARLLAAWAEHGAAIASKTSLRDYLQDKFFAVHKAMYDNRPIHWPLSSEKKTFVAWVNIHRMNDATIPHLLADYLIPRQVELQGLLNDLITARAAADKKAAGAAEARYGKLVKVKDELDKFIDVLRQLAERGPLPPDPKVPSREVDARYAPDLDDGVMINSAALYPVLEPQWKDPKKWWKELALRAGKKNYDWSHLAMRYFPKRVDEACQDDPSLGVAHHCFWHYHAPRAYAWELRLQDEIGPDFRITEPPYRGGPGDAALRAAFIANQPHDALAAIEKEAARRRRKTKAPVASLTLLDPGLWTTHPGDVYELELSISAKQGQEFRLLSPDEPTSRAAFEAQNPHRAQARRAAMADLVPPQLAFEDADSPDESAETPDEDATDEE